MKSKLLGITGVLFVAVMMLLWYAYLMGFDCVSPSGLYQHSEFCMEECLRNYPHLISFTLLFVVPIVVPWVVFFVYNPKVWLRYWLYGLLGLSIFLGMHLFVCGPMPPDSMTLEMMCLSGTHFPNPFVLCNSLMICSFAYFVLFISYIQLQWWGNHRKQKKMDYCFYFLIAIVIPVAVCFPSLIDDNQTEAYYAYFNEVMTLVFIFISLVFHLLVLGCIMIIRRLRKYYYCKWKRSTDKINYNRYES